MDFSMLNELYVPVVILACLTVGYIVKHAKLFKFIDNSNIPVILAVLGAIVNILVSGFSVNSVVYGAVMGLASTGFHQAFKEFIEKTE